MEIKEDIRLPSPFGRIVIDEMREISDRLDKGNKILGEMNTKLDKLDSLDKLNSLDNLDSLDKLNSLDNLDSLDKLNSLDKLDSLDVISDKLDTLPERIAQALRR